MWPFGRSKSRKARQFARMIRAKYDAAVTNADNIRHWANADGLSADAAASPDVRQTLRNRSRYEVANNSYARGIVLTLANDCVGTGPRLQLLTGDGETNRLVEHAFADWAREVRLAEKLRTMRMAKATDGEAFAVLTANPNLRSPIKLDVWLVEADRVTNPDLRLATTNTIDGIEFDAFGSPRTYFILRDHPGTTVYTGGIQASLLLVPTALKVPAELLMAVLGIDTPIIDPSSNNSEFKNRVALSCVTPAANTHEGKFVILAEPLASGKIGKACLPGADRRAGRGPRVSLRRDRRRRHRQPQGKPLRLGLNPLARRRHRRAVGRGTPGQADAGACLPR